MPAKAPKSAASAIALESAAKPTPARVSAGAIGEAGSPQALAKLTAAMAELKAVAVQPMLQRAVDAIRGEDPATARKWAQKALDRDPNNGFGWYLLGIACEKASEWAASITAYEKALSLIPDHAEIANDLGRLAYRLDMKPQSEKLFRHFLARHPHHPEGCNNLACVLRDLGRFDEAIELLRPAIVGAPDNAMLWNTMGTIVVEQGDYSNALVFFNEALAQQPDFPKACYNMGNARLVLGDAAGALEANAAAIAGDAAESDRLMMRISRSTILMALGRVGEGWDEYEARLDPQFADVLHFLCDKEQWQPGHDLAGKSLLVFAEQGLGDEVLFANVLSDVIERLGPDGRLTIAVEPRLVPLFQRSYPNARVGPHATYKIQGHDMRYAAFLNTTGDIDLWAPIGSLLREFRRTVDAFPTTPGFMTADPERVAHWKKVLDEQAPKGLKVGLLWKSAITKDARHRFFSPFEDWATVLKTPGVCFVNLQYGDCAAELARAANDFGVQIWEPPGIDLKQDLDEVAALCVAMDLVVGFSNATLNLAAACGAPTWLIVSPGAWTLLGTTRYPWYPQIRTFIAPTLGNWAPVMGSVGEALAAHVAAR